MRCCCGCQYMWKLPTYDFWCTLYSIPEENDTERRNFNATFLIDSGCFREKLKMRTKLSITSPLHIETSQRVYKIFFLESVLVNVRILLYVCIIQLRVYILWKHLKVNGICWCVFFFVSWCAYRFAYLFRDIITVPEVELIVAYQKKDFIVCCWMC